MRISCIATVYNEAETITRLLDSLLKQTRLPNEVVIVDGGSFDNTVLLIKDFLSKKTDKKIPIRLYEKKGNRAQGRNEAVRQSKYKIIVCTDAGCILDVHWIEEIIKPFLQGADVVAGYYKGVAMNSFQACLIPYVLVMPDKISSKLFLPASRSMAFKKSVWEKVGGFPNAFSHNEDYVFSRKLKEYKFTIEFQKDAIVNWVPRKTIQEAFIMFFRFALGDIEAKIVRPKVVGIFLRYAIGIIFVFFVYKHQSVQFFFILFFLFSLYTLWAIGKNYRYVQQWQAFVLLPLIQYTADIAVILGSLVGVAIRVKKNIFHTV